MAMSVNSSPHLTLAHLQLQHWQQAFSPEVFERGRRYAKQGLARIVAVTDNSIEACCHGSAERPYRQHLRLQPGDGVWQVNGRCNCQASGACKHMVAALLVVEQLQKKGDPLGQPVAPSAPLAPKVISDALPKPVLQLASYARLQYDSRKARTVEQAQHRAALSFNYAGFRVHGHSAQTLVPATAQRPAVRIQRNIALEQALREQLQAMGMQTPMRRSEALPENAGEALQMKDEQAWIKCVRQDLPLLREQGWTVIIHPGFRFDIEEVQGWYADIQEDVAGGWFDLEVGIEVNGQRLSLLPILLQGIRQTPWLLNPKSIAERADEDVFIATLYAGTAQAKRIALPYGRLKPVLNALGELYFAEHEGPSMRLPRADAARLSPLCAGLTWQWSGALDTRKLARA